MNEPNLTPGDLTGLNDLEVPKTKPGKKMTRKTLFVLMATAFLTAMGFTVVIPVLPFVVGQYTGNPDDLATMVGWLSAVYAIGQFIAAPALGILSDRYGRRPLLMICLVGSIVGYIMFGIGGSLWVLFLSRIIDGLTGGDISILTAYIADVTEPEERGKFFGIFGAVVGVGTILGPVIGGFLSQISQSAPFFLSAGFTTLIFLMALFFMPESLDPANRKTTVKANELNPLKQLKDLLNTDGLRMLIILSVLYAIPLTILQFNFSVLAIDSLKADPSDIGLLFLLIGSIDIVVQGFLVQKLLPIFGVRKLLIVGFVMQTIAYAFIASVVFFQSPYLLIAGVAIYAISSGLIEPSLNGLISSLVSPEKQGVVEGSNAGLRSLISVIAPIGGGFLYSQGGHASPYILSVVIMAVAAGVVLGAIPKLKADRKVGGSLEPQS